MISIRPVSDLRNKFPEIENEVLKNNQPIFLTKNGYGSMVILSLEQYSRLTDDIEVKLTQADEFAVNNTTRLTAGEVFGEIREKING